MHLLVDKFYRKGMLLILKRFLYLLQGGLTSPVNTNFSSMNIEQLVAAEAQERQNVEARINMLRTIHALLDAAIIQLNQYTQMVNEQR